MFQEPGKTNYDLNFSVMDVPVRVHPMFWLIVLIFSMQGKGSSFFTVLLTHGFAIFISVLAHELGHALVGRMFGSRGVHVVLHGFGGVAIGAHGRTKLENVQVIAAGPFMGFLLSLPFAITMVKTLYGQLFVQRYLPFLSNYVHDFVNATGGTTYLGNGYLYHFVLSMLWVNVIWGILNLVPIYPLDGGQICSELISRNNIFGPNPLVHKISIGVAVAISVFFLSSGQVYATFLFGYLGYINYKMLQMRR